jgi:hypothetical protein
MSEGPAGPAVFRPVELRFDTRPFEDAGRDPWPYLLATVQGLTPGQTLRILVRPEATELAAFLVASLEVRGLTHVGADASDEVMCHNMARPMGPKRDDVGTVDRRNVPVQVATAELAAVAARLEPGEQFYVLVRNHPRESVRLLQAVGAIVDVEPYGPGGYRLLITRTPGGRGGKGSYRERSMRAENSTHRRGGLASPPPETRKPTEPDATASIVVISR